MCFVNRMKYWNGMQWKENSLDFFFFFCNSNNNKKWHYQIKVNTLHSEHIRLTLKVNVSANLQMLDCCQFEGENAFQRSDRLKWSCHILSPCMEIRVCMMSDRQTDRQTSRLKQCCRELVMLVVWKRKPSPTSGSTTAVDICVHVDLTNRKRCARMQHLRFQTYRTTSWLYRIFKLNLILCVCQDFY